jgi:uncharacterized membrane-anchored protein YitT (DUF2179 family)
MSNKGGLIMQLAMLRSKHVLGKEVFASWKSVLNNLVLIAAGSLIFVLGMNSVLLPLHFLSGGIAGLAMLVHYGLQSYDIGGVYFLLNIPLMLLGWFHISRRFMLYTIFGLVFFSIAASLIEPPSVTIHDPLLGAIFAGVICGIGAGLILRSVGSAGGFDILGIYVNQKFGVRPGTTILAANLLPLLLGVYLVNLETVLYSMIFMFTSTRVIDGILSGFNQRKSLLIVSDHAQTITQDILRKRHRGVTLLKGEGAYSGKEREVIFTITTLIELPKLKELIFAIDPNAFVVVNNTLEVFGAHHGRLKVY